MDDVIVIGAGIAGLVCAQQLQQAGFKVTVVEKSRGLGGRIATRRLLDTCADHGVRYLEPQGRRSHELIQTLCQTGILRLWTETVYEWSQTGLRLSEPTQPRYAAPNGMTAIAKFLATGLDVQRNQRAIDLRFNGQHWELKLDASEIPLTAKVVIAAIPAPQAVMLLKPLTYHGLPTPFLQQLEAVEFVPCFSAIATYPSTGQSDLRAVPWRAVNFPADSALSWVGIDSDKRLESHFPLVVVQSSAAFAQQHLEATDLQSIGYALLSAAGETLLPRLATPETLQVHRWRYAFVKRPLSTSHLTTTTPAPLICCGDWCGGNQIEAAIESGLAAAVQTSQLLSQGNLLSFSKLLETLLN
jgi:renalase